jgi:hypothetical protein
MKSRAAKKKSKSDRRAPRSMAVQVHRLAKLVIERMGARQTTYNYRFDGKRIFIMSYPFRPAISVYAFSRRRNKLVLHAENENICEIGKERWVEMAHEDLSALFPLECLAET